MMLRDGDRDGGGDMDRDRGGSGDGDGDGDCAIVSTSNMSVADKEAMGDILTHPPNIKIQLHSLSQCDSRYLAVHPSHD